MLRRDAEQSYDKSDFSLVSLTRRDRLTAQLLNLTPCGREWTSNAFDKSLRRLKIMTLTSSVDFGPFLHGCDQDRVVVAAAIDTAFQDYGFACLSNHGINDSEIEDCLSWVRAISQERDSHALHQSADRELRASAFLTCRSMSKVLHLIHPEAVIIVAGRG